MRARLDAGDQAGPLYPRQDLCLLPLSPLATPLLSLTSAWIETSRVGGKGHSEPPLDLDVALT